MLEKQACLLLCSAGLPNISQTCDASAVPTRRTFVEKQVTFRMSLTLWQRLQAASAALDLSQAEIVSTAIEKHLDSRPAKDRQLIETLLARRQKP
jgi:predicted DNA-binding protein